MNLGIFLPLGSSFKDLKKTGQQSRFINYYLKPYSQEFKKVFIFSYEKEKVKLPKNCILISNKNNLQRFLYTFLIPLLNFNIIKQTHVFRVTQLNGVIPAVAAKILFKKPFVFTYGYEYAKFAKLENKNITAFLLNMMEKLAFKYADGVIVTTGQIQKKLSQKYPKAGFHYIPNGVDVDRFKPVSHSASSSQQPEDKKNSKQETGNRKLGAIHINNQSLIINLLFVGRLEKQKNLKSLIKAFKSIQMPTSRNQILRLVIVGSGSEENKLKRLTKELGLEKSVTFKGRIGHSQIIKQYQRADIFVLPSILEGHPKVLLEAMACGLSCLVSYSAGIGFKQNTEVVKTKTDVNSIASGLEKIIKNTNLGQKLENNSREKIVKDFNIKKLIKKEIKVLSNL
jgi:glycosyltransferase involved in cell wall biosynthesis